MGGRAIDGGNAREWPKSVDKRVITYIMCMGIFIRYNLYWSPYAP